MPRSVVRRYGPIVVALIAVAFVVTLVPFRDRCTPDGCEAGLLTTLRTIRLGYLAASFGVLLVSTGIWAFRWRVLLGLAGVEIGIAETWRLTLESLAGGVILPGGIGGDALRIAYVRERAPDASLPKIIASTFMDRVVGLVTLATLAVTLGIAFGGKELGSALGFLAAIPVASVLAFVLLRRPELAEWRVFQRGLGARIAKPMLEYARERRGPGVLLRGMLLSFGVSALQLIVVRLLVAALGGHPTTEGWVYVGTTFCMMIAAIPLTPGAWGTADAAYVIFLGHAGIPPQIAATVCLLYRVSWYATAVIGAAFTLGRRKK